MALALKIAILVVVVLVVAVAALRIRKLRRDEIRELSRPVERRLMSPPPSPYAPSKGFRLLDGPLDATRRPEPLRPRLETDREYVFSEIADAGRRRGRALASSPQRTVGAVEVRATLGVVHGTSRRGHRGDHHRGRRRARPLPAAPALEERRDHDRRPRRRDRRRRPRPSPRRCRCRRRSSRPRRVARPRRINVPRKSYSSSCAARSVRRGPSTRWDLQSTLEWQGTVKQGTVESLRMIGDSQITIGAPKSASVTVDGKAGRLPVTAADDAGAVLRLVIAPTISFSVHARTCASSRHAS